MQLKLNAWCSEQQSRRSILKDQYSKLHETHHKDLLFSIDEEHNLISNLKDPFGPRDRAYV